MSRFSEPLTFEELRAWLLSQDAPDRLRDLLRQRDRLAAALKDAAPLLKMSAASYRAEGAYDLADLLMQTHDTARAVLREAGAES